MTKDDFYAWRHSPAGKWFFDQILETEIRDLAEVLSDGSALADDVGRIAIRYAEMCGVIGGVHHVRNLDPFKDNNETESNRTPPLSEDGR